MKFSDSSYQKALDQCMVMGKTVIFEAVESDIDPAVMPLVGKDFFQQGKEMFVRMNDVNQEVSKHFRLYLVSNLSNPHFKPEVQSKTTIVNFAITQKGLEYQLLAMVCMYEN